MLIRSAGPGDAEAASRLVLLAIEDIAYRLTGERTEAAVLAKLAEYYLQPGNRFSAERHALLVAEEGEPAGTILCYGGDQADALYAPVTLALRAAGREDAVQDREADEDEYYIDAVAVFPSHQGRGFAKALIRHAELEAVARGYAAIGLNVDIEKDGARALYARLGFAEDKRISINGHPYRHMRKALSSPAGRSDEF
ncbi:GNAT family N-acetyltransferase [Cohnella rhizosphaerae]|uniref:GNAT family N-acetyltransferase n=1 Tax=Cohnella rhizosphaerae TaxID=1457232 RepID=A0A9X4QWN0_9BACL|nr:GNAT family N-acetyltransferase [Cohnella rhizosphaerae]MDG0813733.1 GNAT family N-acetyltransferase [Cohnella rhizosphaerae]